MALNNDSLHLVYIVDGKYAMLTGISILSLLENTRNTENIVIHIIATDISKEQELYWREIVSNKVKLDIVYRKNDTYKAVEVISLGVICLLAPKSINTTVLSISMMLAGFMSKCHIWNLCISESASKSKIWEM